MKKTVKPETKEKWATHVYLDKSTRHQLEIVAERERRSLTKQIELFIHAGLALATNR